MPSWNIKVPTDGGPVSFLNIFDSQEAVRIPLEARMGDQGTYHYRNGTYRWMKVSAPGQMRSKDPHSARPGPLSGGTCD